MIFQRLNRSNPERVFVVMRANEASIAADDPVVLELTAASVDGVRVIQPITANLWAFVGIADAAIGNGSYGLVQVYGYRSTSRIFQTSISQAAGLPLIPVNAADYMQSTASTTLYSSFDSTVSVADSTFSNNPYFAVLLESIASSAASATVSRKVFLRAL